MCAAGARGWIGAGAQSHLEQWTLGLEMLMPTPVLCGTAITSPLRLNTPSDEPVRDLNWVEAYELDTEEA